jgi:hypothetical protein
LQGIVSSKETIKAIIIQAPKQPSRKTYFLTLQMKIIDKGESSRGKNQSSQNIFPLAQYNTA